MPQKPKMTLPVRRGLHLLVALVKVATDQMKNADRYGLTKEDVQDMERAICWIRERVVLE